MATSKYTELYTAVFGQRIGKAIQCSIQVRENGVNSSLCFAHDDVETSDPNEPEPKRRRLWGKNHPELIFAPEASSSSRPDAAGCVPAGAGSIDDQPSLEQILQLADQSAPRVGKIAIQSGPLLEIIQQRYPDKTILALDICRGVDRMRKCPVSSKGFAPFRRVIGRRRTDLQVFEDTAWEHWEVLSHRQQIRNGVPSRLLITIFATNKRGTETTDPDVECPEDSKRIRMSSEEDLAEARDMPQSLSESTPNSRHSTDNVVPEQNIISHGPLFRKLKPHLQAQIKKIHQNLGHPDSRVLQLALKRYGWSEEDIRGCADFVCPICLESQGPKIARPGRLQDPKDFNDQVSFDGAEWTDDNGKTYRFYHFIDAATNFHVAIPYHQGTSEGLIEAFSNAWIRWAGPPKTVMFDSATEANSETFARFLQEHSIQSYVIPTEAHWQLGRAERNGSVLKHMIEKYHMEHTIRSDEDFSQGLLQLCNAKNAMSRYEGFTPELLVLGKMKPVPGSVSHGYLDSAGYLALESESTEGSKFHASLARREAARIAFVRADHSAALRRALYARTRPDRLNSKIGDYVMYWREGKGTEVGSWHGPGKILMIEDRNLVWVSHLTRLFRCAPEHIRKLSADEAQAITPSDQQSFQLPERSGTGVFQFRELSHQAPPLEPSSTMNNPSRNALPEPDTIIIPQNNPDNNPNNIPNLNDEIRSTDQPDAEPQSVSSNTPPSPTDEAHNKTPPVWEIPVPEGTDDELVVENPTQDFWEIQGGDLIRHHIRPRIRMFFPEEAWNCPVDPMCLGDTRCTTGVFASGSTFSKEETWRCNLESHQVLPEPWTGMTKFPINIQDNLTEHHLSYNTTTTTTNHMYQADIILTMEDIQKCLGKTYATQEIYLASAAKRQKVEIKMKDLTPEDLKLFRQAQDKELDSWLATDTVRKILRSQIPEGQLLRTRWVLTWKNLDEQDQKESGMSRKAKARLVILGYEDPDIDSLPRDSPTLGRDTRMVALQCISSHKWSVRSFDIKTAFLRGSRQDTRILGIEPPPELRCKMQLKDEEACELLKGAYGLINAPLLWYCELKSALLNLGFIISPFDPCLFVLPKKQGQSGDASAIHGVLGIHVDDGIGGGDAVFAQAVKALEAKFPFGSQRQGSFTFTGVQIHQEHNGDIILNQKEYINDIPPIEVSRDRRKMPESPITPQELQGLRGLIGSLQYAATNTRPDLSCRLSLLQAKVTCATVADLLHGNRLLADAKRFSDVNIKVQSLPLDQIRFLSFSDAAFATREKAHSQKGCLILATTEAIDQTKMSAVSPLIWFSKKINRVVSSTLASETYALSGALDLLSWTRLHWAWILKPNINWKRPEEALKSLPKAFAVVDCKSLFDLLQKTSIPQCTEYRTMLEALVIKDRLNEGVLVKWVHSAAQMADSLTKDMDTGVLRSFLKNGKCILHDIDEILRQRADRKIRQQWYQQSSNADSALHVFALMLMS
jgi:transposase InsO family protein